MEQQNDLIVALATPDAVSAIAVVRLSGKGASAVVEKLMKLVPGKLTGKRRAVGDLAGIDHIVAISWPLGKSYTGEEMVDLMCHGSPGTAGKIVQELIENGARQAQPGEFTRRAWMNGRITEMDVLTLSSQFSRGSRPGNDSDLSVELQELTSEIEGFIEFNEDHEISEQNKIENLLEKILARTRALAGKVKRAEILPRVFIMGPVNAGKSTLFNRLYGEETVVVSSSPGTTRDGATRILTVSGRQVEITDSAGYGGRKLDGKALTITENSLRYGDRIVWMDPSCGDVPERIPDSCEVLRVCSMCDRKNSMEHEGWLSVSSVTGRGLGKVAEFIGATEKEGSSWRFERMVELMKKAIEAAECDVALAAEIVSEVLREAEEPVKNADAVERALERFCVGK
jgi:tRNA modification GTPase